MSRQHQPSSKDEDWPGWQAVPKVVPWHTCNTTAFTSAPPPPPPLPPPTISCGIAAWHGARFTMHDFCFWPSVSLRMKLQATESATKHALLSRAVCCSCQLSSTLTCLRQVRLSVCTKHTLTKTVPVLDRCFTPPSSLQSNKSRHFQAA